MSLLEPNQIQLDKIKKDGLRPGIIVGFINNRKVLMFFKRDYKIWMLPQGGIKNGENAQDAIKREIREEIVYELSDMELNERRLLLNQNLVFHNTKHGEKQLETSTGEKIDMIGKSFFFYAIPLEKIEIEIEKGEFDDYYWADYKEAKYLVKVMNIRNKAKLIDKFLDTLKEKGIIE